MMNQLCVEAAQELSKRDVDVTPLEAACSPARRLAEEEEEACVLALEAGDTCPQPPPGLAPLQIYNFLSKQRRLGRHGKRLLKAVEEEARRLLMRIYEAKAALLHLPLHVLADAPLHCHRRFYFDGEAIYLTQGHCPAPTPAARPEKAEELIDLKAPHATAAKRLEAIKAAYPELAQYLAEVEAAIERLKREYIAYILSKGGE